MLNVVKVQRAVHPSLAYQDTMGEGEDQIHTWQSHSPPQYVHGHGFVVTAQTFPSRAWTEYALLVITMYVYHVLFSDIC